MEHSVHSPRPVHRNEQSADGSQSAQVCVSSSSLCTYSTHCHIRYFRDKKKFTATEKQHNYRWLTRSFGMFQREVRVLGYIKDSYSLFEQDSLPSIQLVLRTCHILFETLSTKEKGDPKVIKRFQELLCEGLAEKVVQHLTIVHWQAALLCPTLKDKVESYLHFDDTRFGDAITQRLNKAHTLHKKSIVALQKRLKETVTDVFLKQEEIIDVEERRAAAAQLNERKEQKQKPNVSLFAFDTDEDSEDGDHLSDLRENAEQELQKYMKHKFTKDEKKRYFRNPLLFWCPRNNYPTLSIVARHILTIPSNSSAVERIFSAAEELLSARRMSMDADRVGAFMRLKKSKPGFA